MSLVCLQLLVGCQIHLRFLAISLVMHSAGSFVVDDLAVAPHLDWSVSLSIDVHIHTLVAYSSTIPKICNCECPAVISSSLCAVITCY